MDNKNLLKYKGWRYNALTINTIEYEYFPYKILLCDNLEFNTEIYLYRIIRCLVFDGIIVDLKLN